MLFFFFSLSVSLPEIRVLCSKFSRALPSFPTVSRISITTMTPEQNTEMSLPGLQGKHYFPLEFVNFQEKIHEKRQYCSFTIQAFLSHTGSTEKWLKMGFPWTVSRQI